MSQRPAQIRIVLSHIGAFQMEEQHVYTEQIPDHGPSRLTDRSNEMVAGGKSMV